MRIVGVTAPTPPNLHSIRAPIPQYARDRPAR
jgi:hypothetical protein